MAVSRSRIVALMKVQCRIFNTIFNPTGERLGSKVLRERLKGPMLSSYYPRRIAPFKDLQAVYPEWDLYDEKEEDRLEHIVALKARGKSAPKKKKTPPDFSKKKKR